MTRTARHRTMQMDTLEGRSLMTTGWLTPQAAEVIALTNMARENPSKAATWALADTNLAPTLRHYGVDTQAFQQQMAQIPARPPLAFNQDLANAAQGQSDYQAQTGQQTHTGANGSTLGDRVNAAGYTGAYQAAENAFAYATSPANSVRAFLIDWGVSDLGHRVNMLQPDQTSASFNEVGVGIADGSNSGLGDDVVTMDFGTRSTQPYLLGFAYAPGADGVYQAGEGRGGITISATLLDANGQPTGQVSTTQTWDASGAYEMQLAPGKYAVTSSINGQTLQAATVTLGKDNVEYDVLLNAQSNGLASAALSPSSTVDAIVIGSAAPAITTAAPAITTAAPAITTAAPAVSITPAVTPVTVAPVTPAATSAQSQQDAAIAQILQDYNINDVLSFGGFSIKLDSLSAYNAS